MYYLIIGSSWVAGEVVVSLHGSLPKGPHAKHKLRMSIACASLPLLQGGNATVTSGWWEDGATMKEWCGVSAQMGSMSQVRSHRAEALIETHSDILVEIEVSMYIWPNADCSCKCPSSTAKSCTVSYFYAAWITWICTLISDCLITQKRISTRCHDSRWIFFSSFSTVITLISAENVSLEIHVEWISLFRC